MKKITERRGEFSLNGALIVVLVLALLLLAVSVLSLAAQGNKLHAMSAELVRYIEVRGQVDDAVYAELDRMEGIAGVTVEALIECDYIDDSRRIQFGGNITVTLTTDGQFGVGGVLAVPMQLAGTAMGRSETYWK